MESDPHRGKVSRAWVFRCLICFRSRMYEWQNTTHYLYLAKAEEWARRDNWSKTKDGWKCPFCR